MSQQRVFVTQEVFEDELEVLRESGFQVTMRSDHHPLDPADLMAAAAGYDGLICLLTDRIDAALLGACSGLRVVANVAVGFDNIDLDAATSAGVVVTNTPRVLTQATADLAFALLLATARRAAEADAYVRAGSYTHWRIRQEQMGSDVYGTTLGLLGMGQIGRAVAQRARGFAMNVLYHDVVPLSAADDAELGAQFVSFEELLRRSDFLSLHAPLTAETRHIINAEALGSMKDTSILINTARGALVDEAALAKALLGGVIAGAGLDVYENEPAVDPLLLSLRERVVLFPHLGSATESTRRQMTRMAAAGVRDVLHGVSPGNVVNPAALANAQRRE